MTDTPGMSRVENSTRFDMQNGHGQLVNVQTMHPAIVAIITAAVILAAVFSFAAWQKAQYAYDSALYTRNKVERLVIELDNNNAILMRSGLKEPEDMARGPAGNPKYPKRSD